MKYETKFSEKAFLDALSIDQLISTAGIMKVLGCSRNTAKNMLVKLENEGKVKRVPIEGNSFGWLKIEETTSKGMKEIPGGSKRLVTSPRKDIVLNEAKNDINTKNTIRVMNSKVKVEKTIAEEKFMFIEEKFSDFLHELYDLNNRLSSLNIKKLEESDAEELAKLADLRDNFLKIQHEQIGRLNDRIRYFYSDMESHKK